MCLNCRVICTDGLLKYGQISVKFLYFNSIIQCKFSENLEYMYAFMLLSTNTGEIDIIFITKIKKKRFYPTQRLLFGL